MTSVGKKAPVDTDPGRLLEILYQDSIVPIWIVDRETMTFLDVNACAVEVYGYQRETFLASDLRLVRPSDTLAALSTDYEEFAKTGRLYERRHRLANGDWIYVMVRVKPIQHKDKGATLAQILHVGQHRAGTDQVELAIRRVNRILEGALDAVVSINRENRIIEWSGESERMFGWTADEALGQVMPELIMPERYRNSHFDGLHRYYVTGNSKLLDNTITISALRKNREEFPIDIRIMRVDRVSSFDFTAFIRDRTQIENVTAVKELEAP
ncbi:MAG: two-component system, sensor histidine kinase and response regulator [Fimbriimonadaceae bacterium]|jgi:PAS domain S-box-containing protein|nr:two-component system, sensor histidine kinase and response regulator [Fimbriimonadaceae bacterium]